MVVPPTITTSTCVIDIEAVLRAAGWNGSVTASNITQINISNSRVGCCTPGGAATVPALNWGTIDPTTPGFTLDFNLMSDLVGAGSLVLNAADFIPGQIIFTGPGNVDFIAPNGLSQTRGGTFSGGTTTISNVC